MPFLREGHRNCRMTEIMKNALDEAAEERRPAEERRLLAGERGLAAEERQASLDALNKITDAIGQNGRDSQ